MIVFRELRRQARQIAASLFGVAVIGYFAFHAVEGDRGLRSYFALKLQTELSRQQLSDLRSERSTIERRVRALRPESLDLDMLDERARQVLGRVHEGDVVIMVPYPDR